MKHLLSICIPTALAILLAGAPALAEDAEPKEAAAKAPPADSPMAKVESGMNEGQVIQILGVAHGRQSYRTGKGRIPFYFGGDERRLVYQYQGQGQVVFSKGKFRSYKVMRVDYNPSELAGVDLGNPGTTMINGVPIVVPVVAPTPRPRVPTPSPRRMRPW